MSSRPSKVTTIAWRASVVLAYLAAVQATENRLIRPRGRNAEFSGHIVVISYRSVHVISGSAIVRGVLPVYPEVHSNRFEKKSQVGPTFVGHGCICREHDSPLYSDEALYFMRTFACSRKQRDKYCILYDVCRGGRMLTTLAYWQLLYSTPGL